MHDRRGLLAGWKWKPEPYCPAHKHETPCRPITRVLMMEISYAMAAIFCTQIETPLCANAQSTKFVFS